MNESVETLVKRFSKIAQSTFQGVGYRSSTPKYATSNDLLTGAGSARFGGRWNPKGLAVIYLSLSPETAMQETLAHIRYYGIEPHVAMPRTFVAVALHLTKSIDLTDGKIRQRIRIAEDRLLGVDWRNEADKGQVPFSQRLGDAVGLCGFDSMIVPSSAHKEGCNIVVFPKNVTSSRAMEILSPDKL